LLDGPGGETCLQRLLRPELNLRQNIDSQSITPGRRQRAAAATIAANRSASETTFRQTATVFYVAPRPEAFPFCFFARLTPAVQPIAGWQG